MRLVPILAAVLIMALVYVLDLPGIWGAHPFWSQTILLIGTPIGLVLAGAAQLTPATPRHAAAGFALLAIVAVVLAAHGKADFAASYAEDRFAGRIWYLGWIGTAAMATAAITCGAASLSLLRRTA